MVVIRRRQSSMWETVRETPRDWAMHLIEDYELIDWSRVAEATSWPCALALNGVFVVVNTARQISSRGRDADAILESMNRSARQWSDVPERGWGGTLLFLQVLLFAVSVGNMWWMFSRRRTYQLRMKGPESRDVTSNCRRVALGTRRPRWAARWWGWAVWWAWKRALGIDDSVQGEVWELSVWTPPEFARNLFCWFSPVQLVTLSFMNGSNWYYILPMAAAVAGQCTVLVLAYATMAKDRQILYGEMHNEYNETFVNPRVFAPKRDAGTSTMQDWAQEHRRGLAAHHGAGWSAAMDQHRAPAAAVPAPYASDRVGGRRHEARRTTMLTSIGGSRAADDAKSRDLYGHSSRYSQNIDPALLLGRGTSYLQAMEPAGSFKPRDRALSRRRYTDMADGADVT